MFLGWLLIYTSGLHSFHTYSEPTMPQTPYAILNVPNTDTGDNFNVYLCNNKKGFPLPTRLIPSLWHWAKRAMHSMYGELNRRHRLELRQAQIINWQVRLGRQALSSLQKIITLLQEKERSESRLTSLHFRLIPSPCIPIEIFLTPIYWQ